MAPMFKWADQLGELTPAPQRPLTLPEHRRLTRNGFPEVAKRLAAGTCTDCGLNKQGRGHHDLCVLPAQRLNPLPASPEPHQPWMPRPSRFAA